jgi:hypothetical protein
MYQTSFFHPPQNHTYDLQQPLNIGNITKNNLNQTTRSVSSTIPSLGSAWGISIDTVSYGIDSIGFLIIIISILVLITVLAVMFLLVSQGEGERANGQLLGKKNGSCRVKVMWTRVMRVLMSGRVGSRGIGRSVKGVCRCGVSGVGLEMMRWIGRIDSGVSFKLRTIGIYRATLCSSEPR